MYLKKYLNLKISPLVLHPRQKILVLTHQEHTAFENIVGKGEIARYEQFLLSPQCFLLKQIFVSPFVHIFHFISLFAV